MALFDFLKDMTRRRNSNASAASKASGSTASSSSSNNGEKKAGARTRKNKTKTSTKKADATKNEKARAEAVPVPAAAITPAAEAPKQNLKQADGESAAAAIAVTKRYWAAFHAKDVEELKKLCHERCYIHFVDADVEMRLGEYLASWQDTLESFPDFTLEMNLDDLKADECTTASDGQETTVYVRNVRASGTHTGKPYAFGPFPEVAAQGIFVRDLATNTNSMRIRDNKIYHIDVKTNGSSRESGAAYFYQESGGVVF